MRYFYLTFQTMSASYPNRMLSKRFYVMRTNRYFMYQEVLKTQANAFHCDPRDANGDVYLGNVTSGVLGVSTEANFFDEFRHHWGNEMLNLQMTEMTPMQRDWFVNSPQASRYVDTMLSRLYMSNREGRRFDYMIESIRNMRSLRLLGRPRTSDAKIHYKRSEHSNTSLFLSGKQTMRDLSKLVHQAIKDNDTDSLGEFFVDCGSSVRGIPLNPIFDRIEEALDTNHNIDIGIQHCDCGHFEYDGQTHDVRGETWCDQCFNDEAVYVEDRDEYWARDDAYWSDRHDAYYSFDRDGEDDEDNADPDTLMEYSTNVLDHISPDASIKSSPHGEFLMGIEFEMVTEGRVTAAVDDVRSQMGGSYCVCKYDGSLSDGGLEIVTAPRGLPEHIRKFKAWNVSSNYRAWDKRCCGMHIHIDSHAFTQMTLGKFIMFINDRNNMEFIRKIAGRHPERDDQARTYAAAEDQQVLVNPSKAVKGKSYERYRMVNLQNLSTRESRRLGFGTRFDEGRYDTVEVRIFRASLKKERLLAQIEFTHAAVMFCRVASWRELNQSTFLKWLKGSATGLYPHLADWYGVRRRVPVCDAGKQAICEDQPETVEGD